MTPEQIQRFEMLKSGPCVSFGYLRDYYGIDWPLSKEGESWFTKYVGTLRMPAKCSNGCLSRYELEGFMARSELLTKKWMAARLGMEVDSLEKVLAKLDLFGMQANRYLVGTEFVAESLTDDITRHLPGLQFRTFFDHTDFCQRLHAELYKETGFQVHPLFCETSSRMREPRRRIAAHFDCLTFEPLSTKHSVWLDFRKPLNLPPDRCSKLLYVENRESLTPFIAGSGAPDGLSEYEAFMESVQHG